MAARFPAATAALLLSFAFALPAMGQQEIEALGGRYSERVSGIETKDGKLVVKTGQRTLPLDSVKSIRFRSLGRGVSFKNESKLVLISDDWVRGSIEAGSDDALSIRSSALGSLKVPLEQIRAILPQGASPEQERKLQKLLKGREEIDWLRLKNGGTVRGSISKIDGTTVTIDTNSEGGSNMGTLRFNLAKIQLISIAPLGDAPAPPQGLHIGIQLTDGSSLRGKLTGLAENKLTLVHALGGGKPVTISTQRIGELSVHNGQFVYLSDMKPTVEEQGFPPDYTYEVEIWGWKRDRSVTGGQLQLDGQTYSKGLGVHSKCVLSFGLGKQFATFKTVVGLDDSTRYLGEPGFGGVVFKILLDGKPAKEYPSGIPKRKGQKPTTVSVDVTGVGKLTIVADYDPTSLHVLGRANWADAHLIKKP